MTGWIADVVPDNPIESVWGNKIRNRTITPFATTAERDGNITSPVIGMECYVTATDSLYYYNGTKWVGRARGRVFSAVPSTAISTAAAGVYVDALTTGALTYPENRLVKITGYATVACIVAGNLYARMATASATLGNAFNQGTFAVNGQLVGMQVVWAVIGTAAATYKVQIASNVTNGGRMYPNDATTQSFLAVEDFGTP